jgi:polyisoprenyl-phosphate glycosyltransferase
MNSRIVQHRPPPKLAVVLPCFNESESIRHAADRLGEVINDLALTQQISADSYLYFVDDGSTDATWAIIEELHQTEPIVKGLKLSRNYGHQAALLAGLVAVRANCDVSISIDADLQQDPLAIIQFIQEYRAGSDVVLGVRKDRDVDNPIKKRTALGFYSLMSMLGVKTVPNHADYRLLSKKALEALALFPEPSIFLRAMCMELGFKVTTVYFEVKERQFGSTKYSARKMLRLAVHAITSFSVVPLRMVAIIGFLLFFLSLVMGGYVAWRSLIVGDTVPGWASTALPIYFIGGVQLLCLGVVGEYVGQIYTTVKNRPRWIRDQQLD